MKQPKYQIGQRVCVFPNNPNLLPIIDTTIGAIRRADPGDELITVDNLKRTATSTCYFYKVDGSEYIHSEGLVKPYYPPDTRAADEDFQADFSRMIGILETPEKLGGVEC